MEKLKFLKNKKESEFGNTKEILTSILGLLIVLAFPLLLVGGLKLMGLPVTLSFASWGGACLISFFLIFISRFSSINIK